MFIVFLFCSEEFPQPKKTINYDSKNRPNMGDKLHEGYADITYMSKSKKDEAGEYILQG